MSPKHMETTLQSYYRDYMAVMPSYDLYPGLSRRLGNGYVPRQPPVTRHDDRQINFLSIAPRQEDEFLWHIDIPQPQPQPHRNENTTPSWDLYPSILRNVQNFGTDQMRERLHIMETTLST
ncbi:hypothetical protein DFQ29_010211 [Apophysomyces sp. BC1021]|nr:hypothetical protein DFQ29_010211 [Apophysomyces sp. BC1021]